MTHHITLHFLLSVAMLLKTVNDGRAICYTAEEEDGIITSVIATDCKDLGFFDILNSDIGMSFVAFMNREMEVYQS
ncbi:hypothetical protein HOLleu_39050 [Holothuria leucospilota]|uniref:Uncharacterized protein n=1 Tax=Holothuria leucospilota TaxID=206669 RepID=A0A9Q0YFF7_HOLLE|nr:hypothetical protein HOLleu_39050 [Holothuria leucospilota]